MNSRNTQSPFGSRPGTSRGGDSFSAASPSSFESSTPGSSLHLQSNELRSEAAELGRRGSNAVRNQAQDLARSGRELARDVGGQVKQRISSFADENRLRAARQCRVAVDSLGRVSERFRESNDQTFVADYIDAASDSLSRVGDYFEHSDLDLMVGDARNFTRRHAGLVLGGLFAVGLAVGRFLTASQKSLSSSSPEEIPYEGPGSSTWERLESSSSQPLSHEARMHERARNLRSVASNAPSTSPHGDPHVREIQDTPESGGSLHPSSTLNRESTSSTNPNPFGRPEVRR